MPLNSIDPAVPGQVIAAAYFNEQGPEQIAAIANGTAQLQGITLVGQASDPSVSDAGEAKVVYNSTSNELRSSTDGGPFERLGAKKPYADPELMGGTAFGFSF